MDSKTTRQKNQDPPDISGLVLFFSDLYSSHRLVSAGGSVAVRMLDGSVAVRMFALARLSAQSDSRTLDNQKIKEWLRSPILSQNAIKNPPKRHKEGSLSKKLYIKYDRINKINKQDNLA